MIGPVTQLEPVRRAEPAPPAESRIVPLPARLAQLAVEVDCLAQQVLAQPVDERDDLLLAAPTSHLVIALSCLQQALDECEQLYPLR